MRFTLSILFIGFFIFTKAQPALNDKNVFEFRGVWVATVENIDCLVKEVYPIKRRKKNLLTY